MIRIFVEQKPDGWYYEWSDIPEKTSRPTIPEHWIPSISIWEGVAETFDGAIETVKQSVREKFERGQLQGDDLLKEAL